MILFLLACGSVPLKKTEGNPLHEGEPTITELEWLCDDGDERWVFRVNTKQWSGGGRVWIGRSSTSSESHPLPSVEADGKGRSDRLELKISVATDWRLANSGSSSQYPCWDKWDLNYMVTVQDTAKDKTTDCRIWGTNPAMWDRVDGAPTCDNSHPWEPPPPDTGGEAD